MSGGLFAFPFKPDSSDVGIAAEVEIAVVSVIVGIVAVGFVLRRCRKVRRDRCWCRTARVRRRRGRFRRRRPRARDRCWRHCRRSRARALSALGSSMRLLLAAAAEHRAERIQQQRAADHAGRRRRGGSEKRAAAGCRSAALAASGARFCQGDASPSAADRRHRRRPRARPMKTSRILSRKPPCRGAPAPPPSSSRMRASALRKRFVLDQHRLHQRIERVRRAPQRRRRSALRPADRACCLPASPADRTARRQADVPAVSCCPPVKTAEMWGCKKTAE